MEAINTAWQAMSGWELTAVLLSVLYLVLAIRQNPWCWPAAFCSTAIFAVLFWNVSLLMESALHIYYLAMAVYGAWAWRKGVSGQGGTLPIIRWRASQHLLAITAIVVLTLISGTLLSDNTSAVRPYLDSFTSWGAVITTWMVTRKVLENWVYWLVFDGLSIVLFLDRGLLLTAGLFMLYEAMVLVGMWKWWHAYKRQQQPSTCNERTNANNCLTE